MTNLASEFVSFELRLQEWQARKWSFLCVRGRDVLSSETVANYKIWEPVTCSGTHTLNVTERGNFNLVSSV